MLDVKTVTDEFEDTDTNEWIVTFADIVTLLLVFFIMLYTLSLIDLERFKAVSESLRHTFGMVGSEKIMQLTDAPSKPSKDKIKTVRNVTENSPEEERMVAEINDAIVRRSLQKNIVSYMKGGKAVIHIRGKILFESGSAELNPEAKPLIDELGSIIRQHPHFKVNIKGHTDNVPISTLQFPSNWELSAIRATTVLKYLVERGFAAHELTATGYGDSMPLFPNDSELNRAKNRRIEIVLEKEKGD